LIKPLKKVIEKYLKNFYPQFSEESIITKLSERQKQVLEELLVTEPKLAAYNLGITTHNIDVIKSAVRRKEAKAKKFLLVLKRYKRVLHKEQSYKGV